MILYNLTNKKKHPLPESEVLALWQTITTTVILAKAQKAMRIISKHLMNPKSNSNLLLLPALPRGCPAMSG